MGSMIDYLEEICYSKLSILENACVFNLLPPNQEKFGRHFSLI